MIEEFREIKGWYGYFVSNKGTVISYRSKNNSVYTDKYRVLKQEITKTGYARVTLYIAEKGLYRTGVHRLVAQAFLPNPNNYPVINHKDENPLNNNVENLEWCSYSYNNTYNNKNKKIGDKLRGRHLTEEHKKAISDNYENKPKKVLCVDTGVVYDSLSDAAKAYGSEKSRNRISDVCKGKYTTAFGLKWKFV